MPCAFSGNIWQHHRQQCSRPVTAATVIFAALSTTRGELMCALVTPDNIALRSLLHRTTERFNAVQLPQTECNGLSTSKPVRQRQRKTERERQVLASVSNWMHEIDISTATVKRLLYVYCSSTGKRRKIRVRANAVGWNERMTVTENVSLPSWMTCFTTSECPSVCLSVCPVTGL